MLSLDVIIPTYNRSHLLRKALLSLVAARIPEGIQLALFVVDNNSTDETEAVVREQQHAAPFPVHYILEKTQGSSAARNTGIAAGTGHLIGFIDDDEQVHPDWVCTVAKEFSDPTTDFIGGPCLAANDVRLPDWLPPGYHSVIGVIPPKPRGQYGENHPGMLNGGNAVLRRAVLEHIGVFSGILGRTKKHLLSEEDADLYRRLLAAGCRGIYVPELIILHHIHENRLTRRYHRRWAYWRAVSQGMLAREVKEPARYICGVPRYRIRRTLRCLVRMPRHLLSSKSKGRAFADELATWDLVGFIYGRHFFRPEPHEEHVQTLKQVQSR